MSLMENIKAWPTLWQTHSFHGAALGTALNTADPRLWPRWLLMFGLALTTTGAWAALRLGLVRPARERRVPPVGQGVRLEALHAGRRLVRDRRSVVQLRHLAGRNEAGDVRRAPGSLLTAATAAAPALALAAALAARRRQGEIGRGWASLVGLAQFGVLGINAASRQVVQHLEIRPYFDIVEQPTDVQWSPLVIFLVVFLLGLGLVAWMIQQVRKLPPEQEAASSQM